MELMVALAIIAVLASGALPSFQSLLQRQRMRTAANDLVAAIDLTRSQAIGRGSPVVLAPIDPDGTAWEQGWIVFIDSNANRRPDAGEEEIFRQEQVADGITIRSRFSSGAAAQYLAYNGAGRSCQTGNSQAAQFGTLTLEFGEQRKHIKINMLGRVRLCDPRTQPATCTGAGD